MHVPILIVTRGRDISMQKTAHALEAANIPFYMIRTEGDEISLPYPQDVVKAANIGEKRQAVLNHYEQFIMLDDDLSFFRVDEQGKCHEPTPQELCSLFAHLCELVEVHALVGLETRFMIHQKERPFNTRWGPIVHLFGVNRALLRGTERFDRVIGHEDIDFVLQVRQNDLPVAVVSDYCHTDAGNFTRKGGCSLWRTIEYSTEQCKVLQSLWPDIITWKPNKQGIPRVTCKWSKLRAQVEGESIT